MGRGVLLHGRVFGGGLHAASVLLLGASPEERSDPRVIPFIEAGYGAYSREQGSQDPHATLTYRMALAMTGGHMTLRPRPGRARPSTPPPSTPPPSTPITPTPTLPPPTTPNTPKRARSPSPEVMPAAEPEVNPELEILQSRERELKRFKTNFREEVALVKGLGNTLPSEQLMESLFDTMLNRQREAVQAKDDDRVILEIQNAEHAENPLWFNMRRTDQLNGRVVLDKLARVLNSNQDFLVQGQLRFSYIHIPTPEAGGRRLNRVANESIDQWLQRKITSKTIFRPENTDNMCLTRAVAVAIAKHGMNLRAFSRMKQPNSNSQKKQAEKLCELAGIDPTQPCGIDEIRLLQTALPDYRLCVFTGQEGKECIFKGEHTTTRKNIYLLLHQQHFYAILYPCQAFGYHFECTKCVIFYMNKGEHKCEGSCWRCFGSNKHTENLIPCTSCGHHFAGQECYDTHRTLTLPNSHRTKCDTFLFCAGCEKSYSNFRGRRHVCGFITCKYCKHYVAENHLCFMQPWESRDKNEKWNYVTVYWDLETRQDEPVQGKTNTFEHKPNLLVSQAICDECKNQPGIDYFCTVCKARQHIFHSLDDPNLDIMSQFIDYLRSFPSKTEILLVAHNGKAFDAIFVLQQLIARKLKPELTLQGAKIICMQIKTWKFIDSLMFLPMPLSAMPKSFGLTELKKGYFPYLANTPEHYDYEGPMLARELYCSSTMKSKAADDFNKWYDEQVAQNYTFNFRKELIEYCISDVTILREACEAFRQLFANSSGFDPMFNCMTLSSACMAAYRKNFLPKDKIGIVPPGGYHGRGKQSHVALQWMDYEAFRLGHKISNIYTDREISILGRRVDGYVEIPLAQGGVERRIYQFHGDYWHQCPIHYPADADTVDNRFENTQRLTALFRRSGYTVIEKWECEWDKQLKTDPDVIAYFEAHPTTRVTPLDLRGALCGGRTSALRWYHKADLAKGETIKMADVVSEYPNANLRGKYPYGHPTIYLEGDTDMPPVHTWNGIIKCTVLPPRDLFLPVLPYKCNGKLMFPLCRTCVHTENKHICQHENPADRELTGEWCAPELLVAVLEKGYTLVRTHEVYQYPGTMQYDPETGTDGLLSAYVRRFMALKIQASGWPEGCDTQEQREHYMAEVKKYDGIIIDPTKVNKNPALRTLSKLILNSFWGKFGEKTLRSKTQLIYDYSDLIKLCTDPTKEVNSLIAIDENCLQVAYTPVNDSEESLATSSLLHAAFTTCFGRLQLYSYLDIVGQRALYHDTDSVAYISRPGEPDLPLGTHLGDLTDQVAEDYGPGSFIIEFAAAGPKNYGYIVAVGGNPEHTKICIKVRGITINRSCEDMVTFANLKAMVMGEKDNMVIPIPRQIARTPTWNIITRSTTKNWKAVNSKRRRIDMAHTVPHGYNAWVEADTEDQELLEVMEVLGDS